MAGVNIVVGFAAEDLVNRFSDQAREAVRGDLGVHDNIYAGVGESVVDEMVVCVVVCRNI